MARPKKIVLADPASPHEPLIEEVAAENPQPERDIRGLRTDTEYKFLLNGRVDWRAMVDPKWLYVNKEWFTKRSKEIPESTEGLRDEQLCIRLAGLKELLWVRGYKSKSDRVITAGPEYVAATCRIEYEPNFETEGRSIVFEASADASYGNTEGISRAYLTATAENRAFVRAIRSFLNINIVAVEELGAKTEEAAQTSEDPGNSRQRLKERAEKLGLTLENLVEKINLAREPDKQVSWTDWDQIKPAAAMKLLTILKKKKD